MVSEIFQYTAVLIIKFLNLSIDLYTGRLGKSSLLKFGLEIWESGSRILLLKKSSMEAILRIKDSQRSKFLIGSRNSPAGAG